MIKYFENVEVEEGRTFAGHILLLSAVSVGNVGQLAMDVLLSNAGPPVPQKIGRIFHPGLEAVVGTDPCIANGDSSRLVTSCELFTLPGKKFVIAHFHAPITMKRRDEFVQFFCDWVKRQNFQQVVCFSSTFACDRNDQQLQGVPLRFIATHNSSTSLSDKLSEMGWEILEKRQFPAPAVIDRETSSETVETGVMHLPGSGITLKMFEKCRDMEIPFLSLIMFASEGDNTPEALTMYEAANKLFSFASNTLAGEQDQRPISVPLTWNSFHGRSHPVELY